jgi:hypothetical protein
MRPAPRRPRSRWRIERHWHHENFENKNHIDLWSAGVHVCRWRIRKDAPEDRVLIIRVRDANDTMMKNNRNAKSGKREMNEEY